jgi:flagellin
MSVVINTNYAATVASNNLAASNDMLQRSLNRLSSGSKIVNPADDAGGLAVSMKLSAAAKRSGAVVTNIGNSVAEFVQLQSELTSLVAEKFNGVNLFGSTSLAVGVSEDGSSTVTISAKQLADSASGIGAINDSGVTSLAAISLDDITTAIGNVATMRANNGAEQSRLGFAAEVLTVNKANLESANSRIIDVDVASESTQLARWNILVQSGTAMLAQANQSSQIALKLLS